MYDPRVIEVEISERILATWCRRGPGVIIKLAVASGKRMFIVALDALKLNELLGLQSICRP